MEVTLISIPMIDWPKLIAGCETFFGKSPTRILDNKRIPVGDLTSFIASLEILKGATDPMKAVRDAEESLGFIDLTVLVKLPCPVYRDALNIIPFRTQTIDYGIEVVAFFHANMLSWRHFVVSASRSARAETRRFANRVYIILDQNSLGELFSKYTKVPKDDSTFSLVLKG